MVLNYLHAYPKTSQTAYLWPWKAEKSISHIVNQRDKHTQHSGKRIHQYRFCYRHILKNLFCIHVVDFSLFLSQKYRENTCWIPETVQITYNSHVELSRNPKSSPNLTARNLYKYITLQENALIPCQNTFCRGIVPKPFGTRAKLIRNALAKAWKHERN